MSTLRVATRASLRCCARRAFFAARERTVMLFFRPVGAAVSLSYRLDHKIFSALSRMILIPQRSWALPLQRTLGQAGKGGTATSTSYDHSSLWTATGG